MNKSIKYQDSILYEGKGINNLELGELNIEKVISELGQKFEIIKWGTHSFEYKYPKVDISFFYIQTDVDKKIISIFVYLNKFRGKTAKGLKISNETTLKDIIETYGIPEWGYPADSNTVDAEFEEIGIYFTFKKIYEEDEIIEGNENEIYLNKVPVEIVIGRIGTAY